MKNTILLFITITILYACKVQMVPNINVVTNSLNPDTLYCQEEVCAIETKQGELLVAWIDRKKGTNEKTVSYMVSMNNQTSWTTIQKHDNKDFNWTGNPALAKDDIGNLYLIDMSTNYEPGKIPDRGVFELTVSKDGGKTWSEWKTIVKNSELEKQWPDKPSLLAIGNGELYLSYISFDINKTDIANSYGKVAFQKSKDSGTTWTTPIYLESERKWKPTSMLKMILSGSADFGEQGTSLNYYDKNIIISWGAYSKNGIYFTQSNNDGDSFELARKISPSNVATPVTQLIISKNKWTILYHEAHDVGDIYRVTSSDFGKSWGTEKISESASMVSGDIDSLNNLHVIWNEKERDIRKTYYGIYSDKVNYKPFELTKNGQNKSTFFIGAYQQFLIDSKGYKHAFWIDWQSSGGNLKHSMWQ